MNDTMAIARSSEEGMYLFREGDCLWRINEDGMIDCTPHGHAHVFEFLARIQEWNSPSRRIFQSDPLQESSD